MYWVVAPDMVLERSWGIIGGGPIMVWLRPPGGAPPKMLEKAASRCALEEGPILGAGREYSRWAML